MVTCLSPWGLFHSLHHLQHWVTCTCTQVIHLTGEGMGVSLVGKLDGTTQLTTGKRTERVGSYLASTTFFQFPESCYVAICQIHHMYIVPHTCKIHQWYILCIKWYILYIKSFRYIVYQILYTDLDCTATICVTSLFTTNNILPTSFCFPKILKFHKSS